MAALTALVVLISLGAWAASNTVSTHVAGFGAHTRIDFPTGGHRADVLAPTRIIKATNADGSWEAASIDGLIALQWLPETTQLRVVRPDGSVVILTQNTVERTWYVHRLPRIEGEYGTEDPRAVMKKAVADRLASMADFAEPALPGPSTLRLTDRDWDGMQVHRYETLESDGGRTIREYDPKTGQLVRLMYEWNNGAAPIVRTFDWLGPTAPELTLMSEQGFLASIPSSYRYSEPGLPTVDT